MQIRPNAAFLQAISRATEPRQAAFAERLAEIQRPPAAAKPAPASATEVVVRSRFLVYQNRGETENYTMIGKRIDTLRRVDTAHGPDWRIARREIILDQNVLLAKNLTAFF